MKHMVDPPLGWRYGFPAELKPGDSFEELLKKHGYPLDEIEFAMKYTRQWWEEE